MKLLRVVVNVEVETEEDEAAAKGVMIEACSILLACGLGSALQVHGPITVDPKPSAPRPVKINAGGGVA